MAAAAGPRAPGRRCRVPALLMPPRKGTGGPAHQPIVHDFFDLRYTNRKRGAGFCKEGAERERVAGPWVPARRARAGRGAHPHTAARAWPGHERGHARA